MKNRIPLKSSV